MLPAGNRLKKKKDIEKAFKKGQVFREDFLTVKIVKNDLSRTRFVFVISKKVSKKATARNKMKRRLSEIVRFKLPKMKKGFDAILLASPNGIAKSDQEIERLINKIFSKASLF